VRLLLDSVILIDHFNGIEAATSFLGDHSSEAALSVITRAETLAGFDEHSAALALDLLNSLCHVARHRRDGGHGRAAAAKPALEAAGCDPGRNCH